MSRWEFAVGVPFAALLPFLAARACVMRFCGVTTAMPPPRCRRRSAFTYRPPRVLGAARYRGRAALAAQQIHQRHRVDGYSQF